MSSVVERFLLKLTIQGQALQLSVKIDGKQYGEKQVHEAPYRTVTAWESISDLTRCLQNFMCVYIFASCNPN